MRDANYEINEAGIAIVSIDMAGKLNIMNDAYVAMLDEVLTRLEAERENFVGVIVTSAPVRGFRPMPVFRGRTLNTPNPRSSIRSPPAKAFLRLSNTVSTATSALFRGSPVLSIT